MRWSLVLAPVLLVVGCGRAAAPERFHGPTMGTTYSIEVARRPAAVGREQLQATIDEVLAETGRHLSTYDAASEISRFNAAATTEAVEVSEPLGSVVAIANEVSVASGGAFDITVGPLVRAWGFGEADAGARHRSGRAAAGAASRRGRLRQAAVATDRRALRKAVAGLQLDVDGIAPGYAVDRIAERFEALGVNDYLIELGGEVRARGRSPAGRPWRVAIEAPLAGERKPYAVVELDGLGASTSGDYRDFREVGGRRVSHTIDPRTGAPVTHGLASVCVVDESTARADAFSTALMVLGPEEGMAAGDPARARGAVHRAQRRWRRIHLAGHARVPAPSPPARLTAIIPAHGRTRLPGLRRRPHLAPLMVPLLIALAAGAGIWWLGSWARTTVVILVRHAEAAPGTAGDPDLSQAGEARVRGLGEFLAGILAGDKVDYLYAADTRRAQQTAAPIANQFKLPINLLASSDWAGFAGRIKREHRGETVVGGRLRQHASRAC